MSLREPIKLYAYRGHVVTSKPASEPMTAATLRDHLRPLGMEALNGFDR